MPSVTALARSQNSSALASRRDLRDDAGFGVYVHWPFCASKCPYCDFNSHVRAGVDEDRFKQALVAELRHWAQLAPGRQVTSIFLGGGTPSLMKPETVGAILDAVGSLWSVSSGVEITLEANPSSVEAGRFRGYRAAGVNRVSLGIQSLDEAHLRALGRLHSVDEAREAIGIARRTFERFSFDLIYARPGQTLQAWRDELEQALGLAGQHLSLYQLTIEQGTPFSELHQRGKLRVPDGATAADLYALTQEATERAGLPAYEISNHAAAGEESRHNLLYWRYGEYAGVGAGAHGRFLTGDSRRATSTERNPERWAALVERQGHGMIENQPLDQIAQADEFLLMGLRLTEGVDLRRLGSLTGLRPHAGAVRALVDLGLIALCSEEARMWATASGRMVLNEIVLRLSRSLHPEPNKPASHGSARAAL